MPTDLRPRWRPFSSERRLSWGGSVSPNVGQLRRQRPGGASANVAARGERREPIVAKPAVARARPPTPPFVLDLDGAELALADGHYDTARDSIALARQVGSTDVRQNIRLLELASKVEREGGKVRIEALIKMGDLEGARSELRRLVEHDPDPAFVAKLAKELDAASSARPSRPASVEVSARASASAASTVVPAIPAG